MILSILTRTANSRIPDDHQDRSANKKDKNFEIHDAASLRKGAHWLSMECGDLSPLLR